RKVTPDAGALFGDLLLTAYEGDLGPRIDEIPEWKALQTAATPKEAARMRLEHYRACANEKGTWFFDYISPSARSTWSQGAKFDEKSLFASGTVNTGTGCFVLSPGMRITAKVRVEDVANGNKSHFGLALMEVMPNGKIDWNEMLGFWWTDKDYWA